MERVIVQHAVNISDAVRLKRYEDFWPSLTVKNARDQNELNILIKAGRLAHQLFESERGPVSEIIWKELKKLLSFRITQINVANTDGWFVAKELINKSGDVDVYKENEKAITEARKNASRKRKLEENEKVFISKKKVPIEKTVITQPKTSQLGRNSKSTKLICYSCGETGHKSPNCPNPKSK